MSKACIIDVPALHEAIMQSHPITIPTYPDTAQPAFRITLPKDRASQGTSRVTYALFDREGNRLAPRFDADPDKLSIIALESESDREPQIGRKRLLTMVGAMNQHCAKMGGEIGIAAFFRRLIEHPSPTLKAKWSVIIWAPYLTQDQRLAGYKLLMRAARDELLAEANKLVTAT